MDRINGVTEGLSVSSLNPGQIHSCPSLRLLAQENYSKFPESETFFRSAFYGKRLRMRTAVIMMSVAYIIAFTMAILPVVGVSTYTSTSVCLPLSIENSIDRVCSLPVFL